MREISRRPLTPEELIEQQRTQAEGEAEREAEEEQVKEEPQTQIKTDFQIGKTPKEQCVLNGGIWDEQRQICLPQGFKTQPEKIETPEPLVNPEVFKDSTTGQISGVVLPDGRTFLGLNPDEVEEIVNRETRRGVPPEGSVPVGTASQFQKEVDRKIRLAKTTGNIDFEIASQIEEGQDLNTKEFLAAGTGGAVEGALAIGTAAATVGLIGGPAVAGTAAAVGAGVGLIGGFFRDVTSNIKSQREDLVSVQVKDLKGRKTALQNYISAANADPANADEYNAAFNVELSLIRRDYNTLIRKGEKDLNFWGSDATTQIGQFDVFFESVEPSLKLRMQQAILKPEPTRAYINIGDEEEE